MRTLVLNAGYEPLASRVLEHIPVIAAPAAAVEKIHRVSVQGVYASVRVVTRVVAKTIDVVLEAADDDTELER